MHFWTWSNISAFSSIHVGEYAELNHLFKLDKANLGYVFNNTPYVYEYVQQNF